MDVPKGGLELDLDYDPRVQLAMQQNGVPVLRSLRVTNPGVEALRDVVVRLVFDPEVAPPVEVPIAVLPAGGTFNLGAEQLGVVLSTERLLNQQERVGGHITARVSGGEEVWGERRWPFELLAYNEWSGSGSPPELLAAFVLPNHPSLSELLGHARAALGETTGQTAFEGYERRDRGRVAEAAAAVWGAVGRCGITYTLPPASFEVTGQKIRTPEQVMGERAGTCLDLAVLLASAMEQLGLHALLVVIEGHAFVGVWLGGYTLPTPFTTEPVVLRKYVDAGEGLVFEATSATGGGAFREACAQGRRLLEDTERFRFAVDVTTARATGIRPLAMREGSWASVASPQVAEARRSLSVPVLPPEVQAVGSSGPTSRLDRWKTALLDLGMRNRLISFKETKRSLPLSSHDLAELGRSLVDGRSFTLGPKPPLRDGIPVDVVGALAAALERGQVQVELTEAEFKRRALELYRTAQSLLLETGSSPVYLAVGFVRWFEGPKTERAHEAPVLLVPVTLRREGARDQFAVAWSEEEPMLNVTLLKKFERDFGLMVAGASEPLADEQGLDVGRVLQRVRQAILSKERWEVLEKAAIAPFSFQKFLMWMDLEQNTKALFESPVVRHIFEGDGDSFDWTSPPLNTDGLDEARPAEEDFSVLDTDSSQLVAVNAALDGNSFVLQGPPGTGKSQTIANLIAQVLARGESVLFVSEKRAALEVVHSRLARVGLGDFCLEAHSEDVSKQGLLRQLEAPFVRVWGSSGASWAHRASELQAARVALNGFVRRIHQPGSWGRSVFQATSELIGLREAPRLSLVFSPKLTAAEVQAHRAAIMELAEEIVAEGVPASHRWALTRVGDWSPSFGREVASGSRETAAALAALDEPARQVGALLRLPGETVRLTAVPAVVALGEVMVASPRPSLALLRAGEPELGALARLEALVMAVQADQQALAVRYSPGLYQLELSAELRRFREWVNAFFLLAFLFLFGARRRLGRVALRGQVPPNRQVVEDLERAERVTSLQAEVYGLEAVASRLLEGRWRGTDTDAAELQRLLAWRERLLVALRAVTGALDDPDAARAVRERVFELLTADAEELGAEGVVGRRLVALRGAWTEASRGLDGTEARLEMTSAWRAEGLEAVRARLEGWQDHTDELRSWSGVVRAASALDRLGLERVREVAWTGEIEAGRLLAAYDRGLRQWWVEAEMASDDALRHFRGQAHERRIEQFRALDRQMQGFAQQEIQARLAARLPDRGAPGEMGVLRREFDKKRRHMPVRKLFSELPNVITRIKPCVLMSPLSVARFLDPSMAKFDLVVFDEASQIPPWDAIGAIARGRRVVVVGDSRQLPPTSFFQRGEDGDEDLDEEDQVDLESILDECVGSGLPTLRLTWHYRSRHEDLIAFSNHHYYDNRLLTFPTALHDVPHLGVRWVPVPEGFYDRGRSRTNRAEAEAVVEAVCGRLLAPEQSRHSIGIVTFSMAQQRLIEDLLDERRRRHPELERFFGKVDEPVFIKNLESVQGDERDIMMFSVGYGPDSHGKVSMNFGPLNRKGGERRLNVAITRARELLLVFSTLRADQINLGGTTALGVRHLKTFLDFAARGQAAIAEARHPDALADFDSPFEQAVAERLEGEGYEVHRQVGCAGYRVDLAVVDPEAPGSYLLGVECDGASYHSGKTARDRDRIRQAVLEGLGWRIHRVWSTDWWHEPERSFQTLLAAIEAARSDKARLAVEPPVAPPSPQAPVAEPVQAVNWAEVGQQRSWPTQARPWVAPTALPGGPREAFEAATSDATLEGQLLGLVLDAAPLTFDHALSLIWPTWGFSQSGKRIRARVQRVAERLSERGTLHYDGGEGMLWGPGGRPADWSTFRYTEGESSRTVDQLPLDEIANAAAWLVDLGGGVDTEELVRELAGVFGFSRSGKNVRLRMDEGLSRALYRRLLSYGDGRYVRIQG